MRFAFMTFSTPQLSLEETLKVAENYGYDAIEPRMDAKHAHGIELEASAAQRQAAKDMAAKQGIEMACLATSLRYADPAASEQAVADTHARIDLAADCGIPRMRVFGGQLPEGLSRDDAIATLVESFRAVADHAAERGVTLCFETHDDWCDPAHVAAVLKEVDHPAIAANWDIMHPVRTGKATMEQAFDALKPWIRHLHVHDGVTEDGKLRMVTIGQGVVDHAKALGLLATIDYEGVISGEWINWSPYEEHLPRELGLLRAIEAKIAD